MVVNIKRNIFLIRWRIPGMNHFIVCCKIKFSHEENKNNEKYSDSYYRVLKLRRNTVSCLHRYYTFPSVNDKKFVNDRFSILSFFFFFFTNTNTSIDRFVSNDETIFVYLVVTRLNDAKQRLFFSTLKGESGSILSIIHQLRQYWIEQTSRRASYAFLKNILVNQKTGCCPFIPAIRPTSNIRSVESLCL